MRFVVVLLGALALVGCASPASRVPLGAYSTVPVAPSADQAPVGPAVSPVAPEAFESSYRISPLDQLRIDVFGEPELSVADLPVSPGGRIILPLAGEIVAEGRTPAELRDEIALALRGYLLEPAVAVNVTEFNSRNITVQGAVRVPGMFTARNEMTLMDAIALGQGLSDFSKENETLVFRRQDGQRYVARFDLAAIQAGQAQDPAILPGDIVVVGESAARRLFSDALAVLPAAVGIFIALIQ